MRLKLAPHLKPLPDLGTHEITASQLATNGMDENCSYQSDHIGRTVAVRVRGTIVAGKLEAVTDSVIAPLLILRIGDFSAAIHPAHPVMVAPEGYRLTVTATTREQEK